MAENKVVLALSTEILELKTTIVSLLGFCVKQTLVLSRPREI